jgi:hypothetical protein
MCTGGYLPWIGIDFGISGWLRMRLTSARTAAALSLIVSQSMTSPSVDPGPVPTSRKLGVSSAVSRLSSDQLFFDVCAMKPASCGTTFGLLHLGHFTWPFSFSAMVMINSNGLWHFSHTNS